MTSTQRKGGQLVKTSSYARELEQRVTLYGISVLLRPIRAGDARAYLRFIARTDPSHVRLRFQTLVCKDLARYARSIDYDRDMAFVATTAERGAEPEIFGEVRISTYPDGATAEFALLIRSDMQRRGLGRALLEKAIEYCRSRGHLVLIGQISPENEAMLTLARRCGMEVELSAGSNLAVAHLDLQPDRAASIEPVSWRTFGTSTTARHPSSSKPMPSTFMQAGKLLNTTEFALFAASRAHVLRTLTTARLLSKIKRARALRDKYRDLLKRQRLVTRARTGSKTGTSGVANQRTKQKAELFTQVLQRFENRLAQIKAAEAREVQKNAAAQARLALSRKRRADAAKTAARQNQTSDKARTKGPGRVAQGPQATTESARSARHAMQFKMAGRQAIQAHVSARGRRNQAKRDSRS